MFGGIFSIFGGIFSILVEYFPYLGNIFHIGGIFSILVEYYPYWWNIIHIGGIFSILGDIFHIGGIFSIFGGIFSLLGEYFPYWWNIIHIIITTSNTLIALMSFSYSTVFWVSLYFFRLLPLICSWLSSALFQLYHSGQLINQTKPKMAKPKTKPKMEYVKTKPNLNQKRHSRQSKKFTNKSYFFQIKKYFSFIYYLYKEIFLGFSILKKRKILGVYLLPF